MTMQQYCLKWNNHQPNFISVFSSLLNSESLVDVTLSAEGRHVQAHKLVLSACSSYFQSLFTMNPCQHPIVILKDVKFTDLKVMVDFMYYGEVNVSQEQLPHILKTAEMLKIKGLAEVPMESSLSRHNNSLDRSEMLPTNEGKWSSDGQRQSMTPSPCPLSPGTKRKRLRKSSTGSGSGSTERVSEEQQDCNLTSPTNTMLGTVIKPDPGGFTTEPSTPQRIKQHSSDLEIHRSSSHESENEPTHQITLQIPQQDVNVQHNIESSGSLDMTGPFSSSSQTISGFQWVDHGYSAHFASYQPGMSTHNDVQYASATVNTTNSSTVSGIQGGSYNSEQVHFVQQQSDHNQETKVINNSPAQIMKRKRSLNPQADENFIRALEAVRFGGIGFCKAARIFGVNNRTLWLEYKKRGYPINRLSIKNRKTKDFHSNQSVEGNQQESDQPQNQQQTQNQQSQNQQTQSQTIVPTTSSATTTSSPTQETTEVIISNPIAMISSAFLEGRPVEIAPVFPRSRYFDNNIVNGQNINNSGVNFEI
nr:protein tramtrack, alpha isoform-like isoform X2 [Onthophagus taurus]